MTYVSVQLLVGTLQGASAAGLTFDDVRDLAVSVCLNVTVLMGYDGDVICPGIIDNFGPHVGSAYCSHSKCLFVIITLTIIKRRQFDVKSMVIGNSHVVARQHCAV